MLRKVGSSCCVTSVGGSSFLTAVPDVVGSSAAFLTRLHFLIGDGNMHVSDQRVQFAQGVPLSHLTFRARQDTHAFLFSTRPGGIAGAGPDGMMGRLLVAEISAFSIVCKGASDVSSVLVAVIWCQVVGPSLMTEGGVRELTSRQL